MKFGYPCINNSLKLTSSRTFRLKSYSEERLKSIVTENLTNLEKLLHYGTEEGLLFFRIGSGLVPFASHPICQFDWASYFAKDFSRLGDFIKKNKMRVSLHPDQFTVLNSPNLEIVEKSIRELDYHVKILDLMKLDANHKVQIHVGGAYGDKETSLARFVQTYKKLDSKIKKRLVIENDDRLYCLQDCLTVSKQVGVPVVFDTLHHEILNQGEKQGEALKLVANTWKKADGVPMIDYSNQAEGKRVGAHINSINLKAFGIFYSQLGDLDADVMFEIKDKEKSAKQALIFTQRLY